MPLNQLSGQFSLYLLYCSRYKRIAKKYSVTNRKFWKFNEGHDGVWSPGPTVLQFELSMVFHCLLAETCAGEILSCSFQVFTQLLCCWLLACCILCNTHIICPVIDGVYCPHYHIWQRSTFRVDVLDAVTESLSFCDRWDDTGKQQMWHCLPMKRPRRKKLFHFNNKWGILQEIWFLGNKRTCKNFFRFTANKYKPMHEILAEGLSYYVTLKKNARTQ